MVNSYNCISWTLAFREYFFFFFLEMLSYFQVKTKQLASSHSDPDNNATDQLRIKI